MSVLQEPLHCGNPRSRSLHPQYSCPQLQTQTAALERFQAGRLDTLCAQHTSDEQTCRLSAPLSPVQTQNASLEQFKAGRLNTLVCASCCPQ